MQPCDIILSCSTHVILKNLNLSSRSEKENFLWGFWSGHWTTQSVELIVHWLCRGHVDPVYGKLIGLNLFVEIQFNFSQVFSIWKASLIHPRHLKVVLKSIYFLQVMQTKLYMGTGKLRGGLGVPSMARTGWQYNGSYKSEQWMLPQIHCTASAVFKLSGQGCVCVCAAKWCIAGGSAMSRYEWRWLYRKPPSVWRQATSRHWLDICIIRATVQCPPVHQKFQGSNQ